MFYLKDIKSSMGTVPPGNNIILKWFPKKPFGELCWELFWFI